MPDDSTIHPLKFLGLSKPQFLGLLMTLLVTLAVCDGYLITRNGRLADQGAQSHAALCVLKNDYAARDRDSHHFLTLTPEQRITLYGRALGATPAAIVRQNARNLDANLKALASLDCS